MPTVSPPPPPPPPDWDEDDEKKMVLPPPALVEEMEEEEEPLPAPFEMAPPPPAPADAEEEAEEEEELGYMPPPPPPPSPTRKKGNGIVITLSVVAFFAFMLGIQWQGNKSKTEEKLAQLQEELAQQQEITADKKDTLAKAELLQKKIEEGKATREALMAESKENRNYIMELQQIIRSGRTATNEIERIQKSMAELEGHLADLERRISLYLPPDQLTDEKRKERDEQLKKLVCTYLKARSIGCTIVMEKMCANRLQHHANAMNMTYASRVAGVMDSEYKSYSGRRVYKPCALAYNGVRVELLSEVTSPGSPNQWCREWWTFNEEGFIIRWDERITTGNQPALSEGYRTVNITEQKQS